MLWQTLLNGSGDGGDSAHVLTFILLDQITRNCLCAFSPTGHSSAEYG